MSKPYPDSPFLDGNFAPWRMEGECLDLVVEGEIPEELRGHYYRNGSNPQFAPRPGYHWFTGDGMIHAFHFEAGRCHYRNRWVRTARFELERACGEAVFGGFGSEPDPRAEGVSGNSSNTNVVWHAGRLLSLWEAGPPYEIDPETLETRGIHDYDGRFMRERYGALGPDIMTAHPKLDPDTGQWIGFGYSPLPPWLVYHEVAADGSLERSFEVEAPYASMLHDFIVSSEHAIFPVFPAEFNFEGAAKSGMPVVWNPELGTKLGVLPRKGGADDVVWLDHDPCFVFHPINAHSKGDVVTAHVWRFERAPLIASTEGEPMGPPTLHKWTLDLAKRSVKEEQLDDRPAEFGRVDERYAGKDLRHVYSLGSIGVPGMTGEPEGFNSLFHYDLGTGAHRAHQLPDGDCAGEPIFVPRTPDSEEGDGFVLAIIFRPSENRSDMIVLDAQNVEREPLATIQLPHRIPYGFHGNWRPAEG